MPKIELCYDEERDFWYLNLGNTMADVTDYLNHFLYFSECTAILNEILKDHPELKKKYVKWMQ